MTNAQINRIQELFAEIEDWAADGRSKGLKKSKGDFKKYRDLIKQNLDCIAVNLGEK